MSERVEKEGRSTKHRSRLPGPLPSTRAFFQEARRTPDYSFLDWLHGYVYMRWPYLYIAVASGEHPLSRVVALLVSGLARVSSYWVIEDASPEVIAQPARRSTDRITFADTYHGKVVTPEAARQLVTIKEDIRLTNLEHVIPYALARDIVMRNPDHIVALECPCRAARANPCLPLDVCLIIGDPFASFIAEHHPRRSRWIAQQEAIEVLCAEHERGHVHHAFFKDAMLHRFYAICNCCSCCCGAMQAARNGVPMLAPSGYVSRVDVQRCVGCGTCAEICPFDVLSMSDSVAVVDAATCMGCGVCVSACEQSAISLTRDPSRGEPLEVDALVAAQPVG